MDSDLEDELSVGVSEYLKEWGLSESTVTNFEVNQISFKLLDHIQETELKELIPSLKERILFKRGLNKLQNIIHATESDETVSIDSDLSAPSSTANTSSNELPTTKETSLILVTSAQIMYGRLKMHNLSYPDLAEAVLKCGPFPKLTKYSRVFRYMVDFAIGFNLFGACCVYTIIISKTIKQILEDGNIVERTSDDYIRIYVACMIIPCILIAMILNLKYLAPFSIVGNILLLTVAASTVVYGSKAATKSPTEFPLFKDVEGFFEFLGVVVFSMEGMGVVLPIENHMKAPKTFPRVLCMGMTVVIGIVASIGFFGYWGYGEEAKTPITLNFPWEPFPIVLKSSLAIVVYVTFGLNFWAPFNLVWVYIKVKHDPNKYECTERIYRAIIVLALCLVAIAFPKVNSFMGFLGSFCISGLAFMFPAFIELAVKWDDPGLGAGKWRLYKFIVVFAFGVFLCILGTYSNIKSMITKAE